jgi:hypothetical protein
VTDFLLLFPPPESILFIAGGVWLLDPSSSFRHFLVNSKLKEEVVIYMRVLGFVLPQKNDPVVAIIPEEDVVAHQQSLCVQCASKSPSRRLRSHNN